jgi:molybdopterin molybdotransferase
MEMISVQQAEEIIFSQVRNFGTEEIFYENALGRILAENILADRDLPPFDRPTVDGIAISFNSYEKGLRALPSKLYRLPEKLRFLLMKKMNA